MKKESKHYSKEQIKSIRENLQNAFGIDYLPVNIQIKYLYKDKKFIPLVDDILFVHLPFGNEKFNLKEGWYRIKVTYVRSGVMFFKYIDTKNQKEIYIKEQKALELKELNEIGSQKFFIRKREPS